MAKKRGRKGTRRKATRTAKRRSAARPRLTKRQKAARKGVRTRRRRKAAKRKAARKANRTRVRRYGKGKRFGAAKEAPKRRRKRRRKAAAEVEEAPRRRRRRRRHSAAAPKGYRKSRRTGRYYKPRKRSSARRRATTRKRRSSGRKRSHRKSPKRVAAGRKAARTRRSRAGYLTDSDRAEYKMGVLASESRRGRRRRARRRSHMARMPNPVGSGGPMEFITALVGVALGGLTTIVTDRMFGATHALTASSAGGVPALIDAPVSGQVYNASAPATPIWSSPMRLVVAAVNVVAPFGLAEWLGKGRPSVKSFFQLWGFSSLAISTVKASTDGAAALLGKSPRMNGLGPRLFAPEIDATNAQASAKAGAALPAYTLIAGGTGPAPAPGATGRLTLGAPSPDPSGKCPAGYYNNDGRCWPNPTPPPTRCPPGQIPTETGCECPPGTELRNGVCQPPLPPQPPPPNPPPIGVPPHPPQPPVVPPPTPQPPQPPQQPCPPCPPCPPQTVCPPQQPCPPCPPPVIPPVSMPGQGGMFPGGCADDSCYPLCNAPDRNDF